MRHTDTHCHCGMHRRGSDHCPECGCEEFESVCEHRHEDIVQVEYVDHGAQGEYGWFGKVVARSEVEGMTADEIKDEIGAMKADLGQHVVARKVERIAAA